MVLPNDDGPSPRKLLASYGGIITALSWSSREIGTNGIHGPQSARLALQGNEVPGAACAPVAVPTRDFVTQLETVAG